MGARPAFWSTLALLVPAGCAPTAEHAAGRLAEHRGWITGLAELEGRVYSCSQAGIFVRSACYDQLVLQPRFRVVDLAAATQRSRPHLLACGGEPAQFGALLTLDPNGRAIKTLRLGKDLVYRVAAAPGGSRGAAACADGKVYIFALPSLENLELVLEHHAPARAVAFSPDGARLASAGLDGLIHLARLVRRKKPRILKDHRAGVECLAFSPDGRLL
ncbi:MAG: WD40 repeat domain-containing protein, partial [Planctomycetota bacterium]